MRVLRGRGETPAVDRDRTRELLAWTGRTGQEAIRVWRPHRQIAFGPRDANEDGYPEARRAAKRHGFPPVERSVGGRAVAYTGSTIAFARFSPAANPRCWVEDRYREMQASIATALETVGVETSPGEPPGTFCPGNHSLQAAGKLVGIAQRVTADAAMVAGILVVEDHAEIADVLADVYAALDVPFDPETVGSVSRAGGDVSGVRSAVEEALVGEETATVESLRQT